MALMEKNKEVSSIVTDAPTKGGYRSHHITIGAEKRQQIVKIVANQFIRPHDLGEFEAIHHQLLHHRGIFVGVVVVGVMVISSRARGRACRRSSGCRGRWERRRWCRGCGGRRSCRSGRINWQDWRRRTSLLLLCSTAFVFGRGPFLAAHFRLYVAL